MFTIQHSDTCATLTERSVRPHRPTSSEHSSPVAPVPVSIPAYIITYTKQTSREHDKHDTHLSLDDRRSLSRSLGRSRSRDGLRLYIRHIHKWTQVNIDSAISYNVSQTTLTFFCLCCGRGLCRDHLALGHDRALRPCLLPLHVCPRPCSSCSCQHYPCYCRRGSHTPVSVYTRKIRNGEVFRVTNNQH